MSAAHMGGFQRSAVAISKLGEAGAWNSRAARKSSLVDSDTNPSNDRPIHNLEDSSLGCLRFFFFFPLLCKLPSTRCRAQDHGSWCSSTITSQQNGKWAQRTEAKRDHGDHLGNNFTYSMGRRKIVLMTCMAFAQQEKRGAERGGRGDIRRRQLRVRTLNGSDGGRGWCVNVLHDGCTCNKKVWPFYVTYLFVSWYSGPHYSRMIGVPFKRSAALTTKHCADITHFLLWQELHTQSYPWNTNSSCRWATTTK